MTCRYWAHAAIEGAITVNVNFMTNLLPALILILPFFPSPSLFPESTNKLCGENCSKKGTQSAEMTQPPPTKQCKTCRGHGLAKSSSSSSSAGDEKSKEVTTHAVPSKAKRSPWTLRFTCARLKGSKSSSSVTSSPAVKVSLLACNHFVHLKTCPLLRSNSVRQCGFLITFAYA